MRMMRAPTERPQQEKQGMLCVRALARTESALRRNWLWNARVRALEVPRHLF